MVSSFCEACRNGLPLIDLRYNALMREGVSRLRGAQFYGRGRCNLLVERFVIIDVYSCLSPNSSASSRAHSSESCEQLPEKDDSMSRIDNFSCDLQLGVYAESFVTSRSRSSSILPSRNRSSSHRRQTTLLCFYSSSCRSLKVSWATSGVSCLHAAPSLRFCLFRRNHADHDTLRYCPTPPFHADFSADAGLLTYPRRQKEVQP